MERTVSDGMANPTPSEPPDSLSICALTPITRPTSVDQRASGVAVVDGGVGLDRVDDREVVRRGHLAVERADDPARDRSLEPERAAHGENRITHVDRARVGQRQRSQQAVRSIDPKHCEVGRRIRSHDLGIALDSVPEAHRDRGRAGDDMLVRHDVTVPVVDEAGSLRALRRAAGRDLDDRLRRAVVDLGCRETADCDGIGAIDRHLTYDRRRAVVENGERGGAEPEAECEGGDQPEDDGRVGASGSHVSQCGGSRSVPAEQRVRGG